MRGIEKRHIFRIALIAAACLLIEIFVCNYNAFRIVDTDRYEHRTYTLADMEVVNADVDLSTGTVTYNREQSGSILLSLNEINMNIGTVYLDLEISDSVLSYVVCYTDEANSEYYRSFNREYVTGVEKTKWFTCHLDGQSPKLAIRIDNVEPGYSFRLKELQINQPVPFDFSVVRFALMFLFAITLYGFRATPFFLCTERKWWHNAILACVCAGFTTVAVILYFHSYSDIKLTLMYSHDFTDAIINGRLELDIPVSDSLKAMDNPYDTSARIAGGVDSSWDTAYYNGKYYCYYGVVPILLFFVPYHLLTGEYLQCNIVVLITYCLYALLLNLVVIRILRSTLKKLPFGMELIAVILLNSVTNLIYYAVEPTFYLVPYATGLLFVAAGFTFLTFWYTGQQKNKAAIFGGGGLPCPFGRLQTTAIGIYAADYPVWHSSHS